jgi:F5/8 type C domain
MKQLSALLVIAGLASCSFPDFKTTAEEPKQPAPAANCVDGQRNGEETGVDCGAEACGKVCPAGQGCLADADCESGRCVEWSCRAASCEDGAQNGAETDVDCGGGTGCARCRPGRLCSEQSDCDGGACLQGSCQPLSCRDQLKNGTESDEDCGGACLPCAVGKTCGTASDCDGGACLKEQCQAESCSDTLHNQDETDADCGGSCPAACADGARCKLAEDCQSAVCSQETLRCAAASCDDEVQNGAEPATDCGATCSVKCPQLAPCRVAEDCVTNSCNKARCLPSAPTGSTLSTLGWVATASHPSGSQATSPQLVLDGVPQTNWSTGELQAQGMWFQIDMQKTQVFFSVEIDSLNQPGDAANAFDVYVSDDATFPEPPVLTNHEAKVPELVVDFQTPQVGRYLKLVIAQGGDKWWRMDELRVKQ